MFTVGVTRVSPEPPRSQIPARLCPIPPHPDTGRGCAGTEPGLGIAEGLDKEPRAAGCCGLWPPASGALRARPAGPSSPLGFLFFLQAVLGCSSSRGRAGLGRGRAARGGSSWWVPAGAGEPGSSCSSWHSAAAPSIHSRGLPLEYSKGGGTALLATLLHKGFFLCFTHNARTCLFPLSPWGPPDPPVPFAGMGSLGMTTWLCSVGSTMLNSRKSLFFFFFHLFFLARVSRLEVFPLPPGRLRPCQPAEVRLGWQWPCGSHCTISPQGDTDPALPVEGVGVCLEAVPDNPILESHLAKCTSCQLKKKYFKKFNQFSIFPKILWRWRFCNPQSLFQAAFILTHYNTLSISG